MLSTWFALASIWLGAAPAAEDPAITAREVARGVYAVVAPTEPRFVGSNSGFVVFRDFVLVVDPSFPEFARAVLAEIRKVTDKPIRFVLTTHRHPDHALGSGVFAAEGAIGIAAEACLAELRDSAERDAAEREKVGFAPPALTFRDALVLDDGEQRVELLHFGPAHTRGDSVAFVPGAGVLFTGDLCVNGPFNYLGESDSASWLGVLERLRARAPTVVVPGHGPTGGAELLDLQARWLRELRAAARAGIDAGLELDAARAAFSPAWYREWTGVDAPARAENFQHVFGEACGRVAPRSFIEELGLEEGTVPANMLRGAPGFVAPARIAIARASPAQLAELSALAPGVEFVAVANAAEAAAAAEAGADAVLGMCSEEIVRRGARLRWVQVGSAGVERYVGIEALRERDVVLTNAQRIHGPPIAEHVVGMVLALTRGLGRAVARQSAGEWDRAGVVGDGLLELRGKSALVVGLGGIGTEVARHLKHFGMTVVATRRSAAAPPEFVDRLGTPDHLRDLAAGADLVVNCLPLTAETRGVFDAAFFGAVKRGALFVNIGRGASCDTAALVAALKSGAIAGAALDVTDPEPLPNGHELWGLLNVLITPHCSAESDLSDQRVWTLFRENVRRFIAGERLLSVVDTSAGY